MALVNCHECGNEMSDQAAACPKCGAPLKPPAPASRGPAMWPWFTGAAILAVVSWIYSTSNDPRVQEKFKDRYVIEQCWEDQKRKSLDASSQRFVAGMCEDFEAKFVAKWGHRP